MTVYELTIDLGAPVAAEDPFLHLDGVLSRAAGIESIGFAGLEDLSEDVPPEYFMGEMPLEQTIIGDEWVWNASAAIIGLPGTDDANQTTTTKHWHTKNWRKRFDVVLEHQARRTNINLKTGEFKAYDAALPYTPADELTFYFEGEPDRVTELLERHIPAIGKKRSQGYGQINAISVEETDAESAILQNGVTMRSLPTSFGSRLPEQVHIEDRTVRPPYWHQDNKRMAYPPFTDVPESILADAARGDGA